MTSEWAQWRPKSPALRLFSQPFIHLQSKENTKAQRHWHLRGDFTGDRWIPRTKGRWRGKCFHWMTSSWYGKFPKLHRHSKFWRHRIDMLIKLHPNALTKPLFYKYKYEGLYIIYIYVTVWHFWSPIYFFPGRWWAYQAAILPKHRRLLFVLFRRQSGIIREHSRTLAPGVAPLLPTNSHCHHWLQMW